MYNYHDLNDVEFEELCKDVMEKMLDKDLRIFAKGRDGGIDLTDNVKTKNIVIQVKHYINSNFSNLRNSLKKELKKVEAIKPNQYYVCCGLILTANNINEIYTIFSDYMKSDKHIITLKEIDLFLQQEENVEIVRKHYKLWLHASNILNEIYNQDIFIDCESLLSDIDEQCKYFVPTYCYEKCLEFINSNRTILIIGAPGVGKTITSKMLVLFFATQGYRVRYTTNGDISSLKHSLSSDNKIKEIVLLDDCLGQHYFNMKDSQENELLSLIKYIKINTNKMLILNSRITIFNEAKERSEEFLNFTKDKKLKIHTINMDLISSIEKARIFYNHLKYKKVPKLYYDNIKHERKYLNIVKHSNYTPRIIEYITSKHRYSMVPAKNYYKYIINKLDNPKDIWKNEFERRLKDVDRAFMTTLYSLTDTSIDYTILKQCFNNRLLLMNNIDTTVDNFELTFKRLNSSLISIIDNNGKKEIGVINPSVNDYLNNIFNNNDLEVSAVKKSIIFYTQIIRCYETEEYENIINHYLLNGDIFRILFYNEFQKEHFIVSCICKYKIKNKIYNRTVISFFNNIGKSYKKIRETITKNKIIECIVKEPLSTFYNISDILSNEIILEDIIDIFLLENLISVINTIFEYLDMCNIDIDVLLSLTHDKIIHKIYDYIDDIDVSSYCDDYDITDIINDNTEVYSDGFERYKEIDTDAITDTIIDWIESDIEDELISIIDKLEIQIVDANDISKIDIDIDFSNRSEIESIVQSYIIPDEPDEFEDYDYSSNNSDDDDKSIDVIFDSY
ncbi:restriction endonuclease [Vallitalea guaymasensis]|uniref:nSTAND3 domain-containing NTPase n=1 Tax=Vallitalea guaymasensis TaxID=1185412 RepID=UPI000DE43C4D|nr:restriction endonuclease [Vallitalea guaymasensis]